MPPLVCLLSYTVKLGWNGVDYNRPKSHRGLLPINRPTPAPAYSELHGDADSDRRTCTTRVKLQSHRCALKRSIFEQVSARNEEPNSVGQLGSRDIKAFSVPRLPKLGIF